MSMLRTLSGACLAVFGAVSIVFCVTRLLGDPAALLLPVGANDAQLHALRLQLGLEQPLWVQYGHFLRHAMTGDFGTSFMQGRPALDLVLERLPATLALAGAALTLGCALGAAMGIYITVRPGRISRWLVQPLILAGQATPAFWLGIMAMLLFSVQLGWLPTGGYGGIRHIILPALTLAAFISASVARLLANSIQAAAANEHVRTARALGLLPVHVFVWHVLRNSLMPVLTLIGIIAGELLGGSVVVETVFAWPGSGRLLVQAIANKDFPVIQAAVVVVATLFVTVNTVVDLLYTRLDPRLSRGRKG